MKTMHSPMLTSNPNKVAAMRIVLIVSAVTEAAVGLSLLILPDFTVQLLLGAPFGNPQGSVAGRIAGAALLSLGLCCWNLREARQARAMVTAMLFYNFVAGAVIAHAGTGLGSVSPLLWPTVVLHVANGVWCLLSLRYSRTRSA